MMANLKTSLKNIYYNTKAIVKVLAKGLFLYKKNTKPVVLGQKIVILGNSPEAKQYFENKELFVDFDLLTVNWFPLREEELFMTLKPKYFCIVDPSFFIAELEIVDKDNKVSDLIKVLEKVSWELYIVMPAGRTMWIYNEHIHYIKLSNIKYINSTTNIQKKLFYKNYVLPRSYNVVSSAILFAEIFGFTEIALIGVNLDWMKDYIVDENNELWVNDIHLYAEKLIKRKETYLNQLWATAFTFQGFEEARKLALNKDIKITNYSANSYLQMFEKRSILEIERES